ncbi:hypothetical protein F8S13_20345 [Chloroflexia bacterium SDU3-3]|nr:hypothetical protein F8S13_20345 [Chloroflexia bacterium SDU3-3]
MNSEDRSILRFGAYASLLLPVAYAVMGIALMLDPVEQYRDERYWTTLAQIPYYTYTWRIAFGFVGLLALAVIPAAVRLARPDDGKGAGALNWFTIIAYLGSASLAIDCFRGVFLVKDQLLSAYQTGEQSFMLAAKVAVGGGTDVNGVFQYGGVGLWYTLVGLLLLRRKDLHPGLAWFAIATGVDYVLTLIFGLTDWFIPGTQIAMMALLAMLGGTILAPGFHIWLGVVLLRRTAQPQTAATIAPVAAD